MAAVTATMGTMVQHGRSQYPRGCRCSTCRDSNRGYMTRWRHRRSGGTVAASERDGPAVLLVDQVERLGAVGPGDGDQALVPNRTLGSDGPAVRRMGDGCPHQGELARAHTSDAPAHEHGGQEARSPRELSGTDAPAAAPSPERRELASRRATRAHVRHAHTAKSGSPGWPGGVRRSTCGSPQPVASSKYRPTMAQRWSSLA